MDGLDDISRGSEDRTHALGQIMDQLGRSSNPLLREMASAVQAGELTLRHVATSPTYGTELTAAFQTFWNIYQKMTQKERDDLVSRSRPPGE
ncbi:hypothetical protein GAR06_06251 [Micromonospora saelicesensis]|uniref:hypothetical protein n=1 Tax=Micromonospora saelicesensis TaxID=285676 RepID=UPI000DC2E629|nr:hypothetical protein [Micromonospora saelicesensis]RAO40505.1 hypothetical protein GAR06_06251 [Micromonospora saelicesensis]